MIVTHMGRSPLLLCLPHSGEQMHAAVGGRFSATGRLQTDLSWRLEQVLDIATQLDATIVRQPTSRLVIDVDVDPGKPEAVNAIRVGEALCPAMTLDQRRIYKEGEEPGPVEMEERRLLYHAPFHQALAEQVARLRDLHNTVVVFDCQSTRSRLRGIRDEPLPTVCLGTRQDTSCDVSLRRRFERSLKETSELSLDANRFVTGGYIASRYGQPERGINAMTMQVSQAAYLRHESPPFEPDRGLVSRLRQVLLEVMSACSDWARTRDMMQAASQSESALGTGFGQALDELAGLSGLTSLSSIPAGASTRIRLRTQSNTGQAPSDGEDHAKVESQAVLHKAGV
ncbi:N-formylglutamate amidohydrolase [Roseibium sp. CAU 1637]|uniref:N-formylglutamate amidohydrolase n=1 Tax=Roseibium limicola TaxID=2816037 RepID=A0A939JAF0_9HYPH|nr:N-formylglutamate amidohydrolase [Roseibium limicola]MBO0346373.1 N-formylglutamate amidohydrolase [Roseibium limicola]